MKICRIYEFFECDESGSQDFFMIFRGNIGLGLAVGYGERIIKRKNLGSRGA